MLNNLFISFFILSSIFLWSQNATQSPTLNLFAKEEKLLPQTFSSNSLSGIKLAYSQFNKDFQQAYDNQAKSEKLITENSSSYFWSPSYSTYWGYITLSLFPLYLFALYRMKKLSKNLKSLEEFKRKLSSELHDQVGSILSSIAFESEYLSLQNKQIPKEDLKQIGNRTRDAMQRMRDIVWSLDSRQNQYSNLVKKMQGLAQITFENSNFSYNFSSVGNLKKVLVEEEIKKSIYYIYREAIINILKHSNGNEVKIEFFKQERELILKIKDNGNPQAKNFQTGQGLSNMVLRVNDLGGQIIFNTKNGFEIIIIVPLKLRKLWSAN